MYFWILWKTPELSLLELYMLEPSELTTSWGIAFFETNKPEKIWQLWWLIKWWVVSDWEQLWWHLEWAKIVWVDSQELWLMMKRKYNIRRYKELDLRKSDLEVKKKWVEVRFFWKWKYWVVKGWQNIDLYSTIDFDKPAHGMQIGMMPSKLAHILLNIWCSLVEDKEKDITIYDPFCGFGTTNFLANYYGHHTIWSDINITPSKQNMKRRERTDKYNNERMMTFFKHDVNDSFTKPFLKEVDVVVSEGWLWPVIKSEMHKHQDQTETILKEYIPSIVDVYKIFLENSREKMLWVPLVMTIPEYLRLDHPIIADRIAEYARLIWYKVDYVWEVYQRKKQQIGRRVVLFT